MKAILPFFYMIFSLSIAYAQTVTDYDGNTYDTVCIGNQVWLKQNLRVTHFRNGDIIPNVTEASAWPGMTSGARCYYDNDSAANDLVYGALYNWYAVNNTLGLCPQGWHVPSDAEWTAVETFLGGSAIAGGKMKESGTNHWKSPNTGATNESGFSGLPGGMRGMGYVFETLTENGLWWSSTAQNNMYSWSRYLWYLFAGVDRNPTPKTLGLSVRCVMDVNVGEGTPDQSRGMNIYPNPCNGLLKIEYTCKLPAELYILDSTGNIFYHERIMQNSHLIDTSVLPRGFYLVELTTGSTLSREKLIID